METNLGRGATEVPVRVQDLKVLKLPDLRKVVQFKTKACQRNWQRPEKEHLKGLKMPDPPKDRCTTALSEEIR